MTIQLPPDLEEALEQAARRHGTTPDSFVESLVQKVLSTAAEPEPQSLASTSLRAVARDLGLSASGLKKFLQGRPPYTPTVRVLRRWYNAWHKDHPGRQLLDQVDELVAMVTEGDRARVRREVLAVIASADLIQPVTAKQAKEPPPGGGAPGQPPPESLAEFLEGYAGVFDSRDFIPGGARLSEDTGEQFADILVEKRAQGDL